MLYCIKSHAINACYINVPYSPLNQLVENFSIIKVDIGAHEIIVVSIFQIYFIIPFLTAELVDGLGHTLLIPIDSIKMSPVPSKVRILSFSTREVKLSPCTNSLTFTYHLVSIVSIEFLSRYFFHLISTHLMIEHYVGIHIYASFLKRLNRIQILLLSTVLCSNRTLLIKFSKII